MKFKLFDTVRLTTQVANCGVSVGTIGVVVEVYTRPQEGYEVEFCDAEGRTIEIMGFSPEQLEAWPQG